MAFAASSWCPPSNGARTVADEQQAGVRPCFIHVGHNAILGWRSGRVAGSVRLTQLRLLESVEVNDGEFATKTVEQVGLFYAKVRKTTQALVVVQTQGFALLASRCIR